MTQSNVSMVNRAGRFLPIIYPLSSQNLIRAVQVAPKGHEKKTIYDVRQDVIFDINQYLSKTYLSLPHPLSEQQLVLLCDSYAFAGCALLKKICPNDKTAKCFRRLSLVAKLF